MNYVVACRLIMYFCFVCVSEIFVHRYEFGLSRLVFVVCIVGNFIQFTLLQQTKCLFFMVIIDVVFVNDKYHTYICHAVCINLLTDC